MIIESLEGSFSKDSILFMLVVKMLNSVSICNVFRKTDNTSLISNKKTGPPRPVFSQL